MQQSAAAASTTTISTTSKSYLKSRTPRKASSSCFDRSHQEYYNPITRIQALIKNLDAELNQLCAKVPLQKNLIGNSKSMATISYYPARSAHNSNSTSNSPNFRAGSLLTTAQPETGAVSPRTLAGIYRSKVIDAYRNRRIFTVYGNYHTIRRALLRRGWLEKLTPGRYPKLQQLSEEVLLQHAHRGNDYEAVAISRIINHFPAFFIWQPKAQRDLCTDVLPHRNRVRRGRNLDFSTKVGLIGCAEQEQWYRQDGVCGMSYPRFYRLGGTHEERLAFIDDFQHTQCRSLLQYITEHSDEDLIDVNETHTVPLSVIGFALDNVRKQLSDWDHAALDDGNLIPKTTTDAESVEWKGFFENSNAVLQNGVKFKGALKELREYIKSAKSVLEKMTTKRSDYNWDGCRNLWILKPGYQCRGIGIIIRNSLQDILQWANVNTNRRYIAQKYIERPLLIYKTKFDIRQYMLLSIGESTVSVWLYKDCYLRFSSQEFTVDDLRESIHLTNNSVQKRYKNKQARDARLPRNNMWTLEQFKLYLQCQGAPEDTWATKVFRGFKENLVAVVMASLEETEFVENSFELYGCDFMLDEQYNPILIEINSTPDLSPSTEVTARICPMALKDLVKVIVDLPRNSRAPTGLFELVYEVNYEIHKDFHQSSSLDVCGKAATLFKPTHRYFKPKLFRQYLRGSNGKGKGLVKNVKKQDKLKSEKNITNQENDNKMKTADAIIASAGGKPLESAAKEALALRYTIPK